MDKYKFWFKISRVWVPCFSVLIIVLTAIILYSDFGALPDAIIGMLVGSGMGVLQSCALGNKHNDTQKDDKNGK